MANEESLLKTLIEHDAFYDADSKVKGIATLAIDKGFDNLSVLQKNVLDPFLTHPCAGVRNPGGHHNDCQVILSEGALEEAYEQRGYFGDLLCEDCRDESEGYSIEREKFMRD